MGGTRSAHLRILRAHEHLKEVQEIFRSFGSDFCVVKPEINRKDRKIRMRVVELADIPNRALILLGDAAHSLRCALDHLVFSVSAPKSKAEEKALQFPICRTRKDFNSFKSRNLKCTPRRFVTAMERLQPYHRRKDPTLKSLLQIHLIDNWDKHRMLIVAPMRNTSVNYRLFTPSGSFASNNGARTFHRVVKKGTILTVFDSTGIPRGTKVKVDHQIVLEPIFDRRMPRELRNLYVIDAFNMAISVIENKVIPAFEKLLPHD